MRTRRSVAALTSLASIGVALGMTAGPVAAAPVTVHYPHPIECPDTGDEGLQQCVDSVDAGSTVILTSEIIDEDVSIAKDLTLRGTGQSRQPRLRYVFVGTTAASQGLRVTVQDIRVEYWVSVTLAHGSDHDVRLRRLEVGKGVNNARGIDVTATVPGSVTVEGSYIRSDEESQDDALSLFADDPDGPVVFRAIGNRIDLHGNPDSGSGIELVMQDDGTVRADLMNNVIWDVGRCNCGAASSIAVLPYRTIRADVNIIGNTLERSRTTGIQQRNALSGIGRLRLDVFDNSVSHTQNQAISLTSGGAGTLVYRAGYNNAYASGASSLEGNSAGPGNRHENPRYVDRGDGDLRLRADSPLIDKGLVCTPGGLSIRDAAGRHRLAGARVDIGAYERGAGSTYGVVRLGTSGRDTLRGTSRQDILCGFGDNDTLCAKDGRRGDYADGGSGRDKARTDTGDTRRSIEVSGGSC